MAVQASESCARCHIAFGTHETRVAHNGKPYHEDCVGAPERKPPHLKISELLLVIRREGIHIEPKHRFGKGKTA